MASPTAASCLAALHCPRCDQAEPAEGHGTCRRCGAALRCRYDAERVADPPVPGRGLERWASLLPLADAESAFALGVRSIRPVELPALARELGLERLVVQREGLQPTGSTADRGLAVAVAAQVERAAASFTMGCAGPDAAALAAHARLHGRPCRVALPSGAAPTYRLEARLLGARVVAVLGDATAADAWVAGHPGGAQDRVVSAFAEPFRLEGAKTLAYDLWEALRPDLPDTLVVPCGTGLTLLGLSEGFRQLAAVGWHEAPPPRLVAAQVDACAPLASAVRRGLDEPAPWPEPHRTLAESLRVASPSAGAAVLAAIRESGGTSISVSEAALLDALRDAARADGVLLGPEGATALAALAGGLGDGRPLEGARQVLIVDTVSLHRSPEALEAAGVR